MENRAVQTFNIIKRVGKLKEVETVWGWKATAQDKLFVDGLTINGKPWSGFVPCLDYQTHFIYEVPDSFETRGVPSYMCTCGSYAVIIGQSAFIKDASELGLHLACFFRNGYVDPNTGDLHGKHADGSF